MTCEEKFFLITDAEKFLQDARQGLAGAAINLAEAGLLSLSAEADGVLKQTTKLANDLRDESRRLIYRAQTERIKKGRP